MRSTKMKGALAAGILATGLAVSATSAQAATFAVNNANNSGPGSLRSAINAAEGTAAPDVIRFAIPGAGPHTITPLTELPTITQPLTIRGYSQSGSAAATATTAADLRIIVDAGNVMRGLDIGGDDVEVRGLNIQDAQTAGVFVEGNDIVVAGNHIGTGVAGEVAIPNGDYGVQINGTGNRIGGPAPADRNVISSNGLAEVYIENGSGHVVEGNRIGTDADGEAVLGVDIGVRVDSDENTVRDNLVAGENNGVRVYGNENVLQGNLVGTDAAGAVELPNFIGVNVVGGDRNQIGGTADGEGNVISGNDASGLQLTLDGADLADDNTVEGNFVGTTAAGDAALGNGSSQLPGVQIFSSTDNTLEANVISGNVGDGIGIEGEGADRNFVLGNWIGTNAAGEDLGNGGSGVEIDGGDGNRIGETVETGSQNTISRNGDDGVTVVSGTRNTIVRNSITANDEHGIDLGADGGTPNDALDADAGANDLQNGPEIQSATATSVTWELESASDTRYRLEFYANASCDGSGSGEAQTYLGSTVVRTDINGNKDDTTFTTTPAGVGVQVSMTATRLDPIFGFPNLTVPASTSELSPCELTA